MGAGLLAKAVYQSAMMLTVMTPSRASPLPHGFRANNSDSGIFQQVVQVDELQSQFVSWVEMDQRRVGLMGFAHPH